VTDPAAPTRRPAVTEAEYALPCADCGGSFLGDDGNGCTCTGADVHHYVTDADREAVTRLGAPEPLRDPFDVAEHLGATVDRGDLSGAETAGRRLYKDTACGAWLDLSDPRCVTVGTIVEGSDVEPIVPMRRLWYPFLPSLLDKALADVEADADVCWRHVNECPDECEGWCGYSDAAAFDTTIDLNLPGPNEAEHHDELGELRAATLDHRGTP